MREFVFGTEKQYKMLENDLEDHMCHVYPGCEFPRSFSQCKGRLGFEKEGETYALFIDKGIRCSSASASSLLLYWLAEGTLRFLDYNDMKLFLQSLKALY